MERKLTPELNLLHAKARAVNEVLLARGVNLVGFWSDPTSGTEIFSVRDPRPQDSDILREFVGPACAIVPYEDSPIDLTGA